MYEPKIIIFPDDFNPWKFIPQYLQCMTILFSLLLSSYETFCTYDDCHKKSIKQEQKVKTGRTIRLQMQCKLIYSTILTTFKGCVIFGELD